MNTQNTQLFEIAVRIREMREIIGYSEEQMAQATEVSPETYRNYETGEIDLPFTFIHKCAQTFGIELNELLEGKSARLSSYTVTRKGKGLMTAKEEGIFIQDLAPKFKSKIAEPYWVKYEYSEEQQHQPIHLIHHPGQEFDLVISGALMVQVGTNKEILHAGDSIYYNSSTPHGMIAVEGEDCVFCAVVLPGQDMQEEESRATVAGVRPSVRLLCEKFVKTAEDADGRLQDIRYENTDKFNFGFDVVDAVADKYPHKLAMLYVDKKLRERRFTFKDIKQESARAANYFRSLGIEKGDRVMLVLKRHYQFWFSMIALHKLGAVAIPATYLLKEHDLTYRFKAANIKAIICTVDNDFPDIVDAVAEECENLTVKVTVGGSREGWHDYDEESTLFSRKFVRTADTPCGSDPALMFFSSGTTGNPKMVEHAHTYSLGHFTTAKYWHCCERDGLHFTISDTGWGKALWGKLYGQWMCEGAVFVYDFDRFKAEEILPMFRKYNITTFCAPPTMLRMFIKSDLSRYDFSSLHHITTAGEALNPEVARQFKRATGLEIAEGFGQTETTLTIANFYGSPIKIGSMGKASPQYDVQLINPDGDPVLPGETGEIVVSVKDTVPCGLFSGYVNDPETMAKVWHDGYYHTGDVAWRDEDGYFWYFGRIDDVIKSSGYRIGPFEIESIIMELPYVLECGVSAAPDEVRGQIVKASIVLTKGTEPTEELKKEIQDYVKQHTAPYKYPRRIVFRDELPKTVSGKIIRNKL